MAQGKTEELKHVPAITVDIALKINELIEIINKQQEEIEKLSGIVEAYGFRIDRLELDGYDYGIIGEAI